MGGITVAEAIDGLERLLPLHEPELWASLQPPASAEDLQLLRTAVAPLEVSADLIELLSWRNGGSWGGPWWPILDCGHLLGTGEAVEDYRWLCENTEDWQWRRSWLPIAHEGHYQSGIELGEARNGLIVDASFDPVGVVAPSLIALLHATCAVLEAGLQHEEPSRTSEGIYVRVRQKALIAPIYDTYTPGFETTAAGLPDT